MIGNDIVDLKLARLQSNWKRERWFQKVFTASEIEQIRLSEEPNTQVWKFWSMKEAAYKAHQRRFGLKPCLNPRKISCISKNLVSIDRSIYDVQTASKMNYVYSVAYASKAMFKSQIFHTPVDIKAKIIQSIFGQEASSSLVTIEKDKNNIPMLSTNKYNDIAFSITHHGKYTAYVVATS